MNRQFGFTLIELIVTMALAVIVLTIGVPSFQDMLRTNRAATQTNEFTSAITLARSEAAKRNRNVVLCPSTDQASCTGGTDWAAGWIAFVDLNDNDTLDGTDVLLRVWEKLSGNPTYTGPATLTYRPSGEPKGTGTAQQFSYTLDSQNYAICINPVGRSNILKDVTTCP